MCLRTLDWGAAGGLELAPKLPRSPVVLQNTKARPFRVTHQLASLTSSHNHHAFAKPVKQVKSAKPWLMGLVVAPKVPFTAKIHSHDDTYPNAILLVHTSEAGR